MRSENWLGNSTGGPPSSTRRKREPAGSIMSSHSEIKSLIVVGPRYSSPLYRIISCIQFGKDSSFIPCTLSLSLSLSISRSLFRSQVYSATLSSPPSRSHPLATTQDTWTFRVLPSPQYLVGIVERKTWRTCVALARATDTLSWPRVKANKSPDNYDSSQ